MSGPMPSKPGDTPRHEILPFDAGPQNLMGEMGLNPSRSGILLSIFNRG